MSATGHRPWTAANRPIWSLVSGYAGAQRRNRLLGMFQVYADESGKGQGRMFTVAGFISTAERWADFSDAWDKVLPPERQPFKMSDAINSQSGLETLRSLIPVINKHAMLSYALSIPTEVFQAALKGVMSISTDYPDIICRDQFIRTVLRDCARRGGQHGIDGPVDFIFDDMDASVLTVVMQFWDLLKRDHRPEQKILHRFMGNDPVRRRDTEARPLQAADILAWPMRECAETAVLNKPRTRHDVFSALRLTVGVGAAHIVRPDEIKAFAEDWRSSPLYEKYQTGKERSANNKQYKKHKGLPPK
jgi:hypothetical protein